MDKILLPVDFQDTSKNVVHQAAFLARQLHCEIVILHVVTPLSYSAAMLDGSYVPASLSDLLKELISRAQKDLNDYLAPELEGLAVRRLLREGDPAIAIVKTAQEEKVNLIVLPTHGYESFRRFLLGSVTAKVLHDSEFPIWTGAHLEDKPARDFAIRHILCGIDLSAHSESTVRWAAQLAAKLGARLTIGHIIAGFNFGIASEEKVVSSANQQIAKLQQALNTKAEVFVKCGDVPKLLNRAAEEIGADVLVIGRAAHALGRLRTTGYAIIRESRIPVASV